MENGTKFWMAVLFGASLVGCASAQPRTQPVQAARVDLGDGAVRIVAHRPPPKLYKYVGRIKVHATTTDLVDAARKADEGLRRQAEALGADVVRIDVIKPPRDNARPRRRLILAGRAYRYDHPRAPDANSPPDRR